MKKVDVPKTPTFYLGKDSEERKSRRKPIDNSKIYLGKNIP